MKPRIGFVMEQALGHVAYGLSLRRALAERDDFEARWLDIPFDRGRFGRIPVAGSNWTLRASVRAQRAVARELASGKLDALFVHTQTVALFSIGHMGRIPTLLSLDATPRNYDELAGHYGDRVHPPAIESAKLWAHRRVAAAARLFTTWSDWAKRSLVSDYGAASDRVTVIHPGTVFANFPSPHEKRGRRPGPLRVLFVGGDFQRKGGDLLLQVARERLRGRVELHLVTGADVPAGEGIFVYRGLKPHSPELLGLYADADVFALPTRADCLAVVLGEAMASCLPIVTTRVGAHGEVVEDGKSGFLVDTGDAAQLADRLERFVERPELARELGLRGRAIGEERFDMNKNAARIAELLLGLCRR